MPSLESLPIHNAKTEKYPEPLAPAGTLDGLGFVDVTPVIGREYPRVNLVNDILHAENSDALLRDLAIAISQRGVVFFRAQDNLTDDLQKKLVQQLGQLSGKPAESTLHVHPTINNTNEFGVADEEISIISSKGFKSVSSISKDRDDRRWGAASWHSDIQFEEHPADYTSLRLTQLPPGTGGDTLWASGYELYDRFSEPYQKFLEGLTATFSGAGFVRLAKERPDKVQINKGPRGHPRNVGADLTAVHPVVRTNPVTGWKSIFAIGNFPVRVNELSARESRELLDTLYQRILENHDLQVRFKWQNKNDIAIWDNRSVFHSATNDYDRLGDRAGHRAVGIGEKPYLDPQSQSRTIALGGY
ncbi:taurine dioxygenase family protein [Ophiostoma piceae UAMH 11346]|uniref:Taurine dioxygenase family protein n=1 Tax=Ophiostoma piceae (strain UAMH 11346) TaxID=1262450 RepID=S3C3P8_OPHP1|nr:taurine dioxygenase family protein [Ophiostoma piceae UAMH 11346]